MGTIKKFKRGDKVIFRWYNLLEVIAKIVMTKQKNHYEIRYKDKEKKMTHRTVHKDFLSVMN